MEQPLFLPQMPEPARCSFGSVTIGTKTYIIGGHTNQTHEYAQDNFTDVMDMYDTSTNTWTRLAPRPRASQGFFAAAYDNYIYAFGGLVYFENADPTMSYISIPYIDRYHIATNTWITIGSLPTARSSYFGGVINDFVYLIGGWNGKASDGPVGGTFLNSVDGFNLVTEQAYPTNYQMPGQLRRAGGAVTKGSTIVIAGGITNTNDPNSMCLSSVLCFAPYSGNTWYWEAPLPLATFAPGLGLDNKMNLYSFGGYQTPTPPNPPPDFVKTVYFLPNNGSSGWSTLTPMQEDKGFVTVILLAAGSTPVFGLLGGALDPAESGYQSNAFELYYDFTDDDLSKSRPTMFNIPKH